MTGKINSKTLQMTSFDVIFYSGDAWTLIHEAFRSMRKETFKEVEERLQQANGEILHTYQSQTQLLKGYASETKIKVKITMVYAQGHPITTMILLEIAQEMDYLYQKNKQKGGIVVRDIAKRKVELEREQLSLKNMYFDCYLIVCYLTVFLFFMNMQWMILLLPAKSPGSSLPMILILAILPVVGEQVKLYRKHQTSIPWTKRYLLFWSVFNLLVIPVLFTSEFTFLYPFMANSSGGQLFIFILVANGIFASAFIQYRLKKISSNQDQQYIRTRQYEKALYLRKENDQRLILCRNT